MFDPLMDTVEDASALDPVVNAVRSAVTRLLPWTTVRDLLHGVWLGHPVHPAAVQLPIGAFASAAILDALPGTRGASALIGVGLASSAPATVTGLADWSQGHEQQQRVGIVHASSNLLGLALYAASLVQRSRGGSGRLTAYSGLSALSLGAYIGGHLAYRQSLGANHAEHVSHVIEPGWHDLLAVEQLPPDGQAMRAMLNDEPLVVVRRSGTTHVLAARCSHLSGPLQDGEITADGCIQCPWHGSQFRLADGTVAHGPATSPQPTFEVREENGSVQVRLPGAG